VRVLGWPRTASSTYSHKISLVFTNSRFFNSLITYFRDSHETPFSWHMVAKFSLSL
jgi:hypothetical protein